MGKSIFIFLLILVLCSFVRSQCPKYTCEKLNENVCAKFDGKNYVINSNVCANKYTCDLRGIEPTSTCTEDQRIFILPGMWAPSDDMCESKTRNQDGICVGKQIGESCNFDFDCDVDSYCEKGTQLCVPARNEKEVCGGNLQAPFCKSYLSCYNGFCEKFGKFPIGNPSTDPRMCISNEISEQNICKNGTELVGDILRDSFDEYCYYSDDSKSIPSCTYREDGKAICGYGSYDTLFNFETLLNYLKTKPSCSIFYHYGICDNGKKAGDLRAAVDAYARLPYHVDDLQKQYIGGIAKCIKSYQHPEIWRMASEVKTPLNFGVLLLGIIFLFFF